MKPFLQLISHTYFFVSILENLMWNIFSNFDSLISLDFSDYIPPWQKIHDENPPNLLHPSVSKTAFSSYLF